MGKVFVLKSKKLQDWGHSIGITKYIFKFGFTISSIKEIIIKYNSIFYAGKDDWSLILSRSIETTSEEYLINKLSSSMELLDPNFYPQIQDSSGIFRVKKDKLESSLLIKQALEDKDSLLSNKKINDKDFANYILDKVMK
ncbi:MAG: hypothetical protein CFH01_01543 [Alphaproteobacteria bacterium MarineAlpha2_Bin1]|nr:MAG: hypothetical protein CFH01_01543 [Alphaproteobacteria bacterium MarineAlpha2_Bin1]|tara:strand:+ start:98 stop:517 length:420 start_codon:yes stop_codon:yes gene_type:complete